jgi:hypothetical protein
VRTTHFWIGVTVVLVGLVGVNYLSEAYAQKLANVAACAGALVAGVWVYWTWKRAEDLRRRREILAIEANIVTKLARLDDQRSLVHVTMNWKNNGVDIITAMSGGSKLEVYEVSPELEGPNFSPGRLVTTLRPFETRASQMTLEPATVTGLECVVVLNRGETYYLKAYLQPKRGTVEPEDWCWHCTTIIEVPLQSESTGNQPPSDL